MTLELHLSDAQYERLKALANARGLTPSACLREFIDACQPGGSGWVPPWVKTPKEENE